MKSFFKIIFVGSLFTLSLNIQKAFSQIPTTPTNPSAINPLPVPNPASPVTHPTINPSTYPVDTSSIHISSSPNQPVSIPPARNPIQQQRDTVFRSIDENPDPMQVDSIPKN